MISNKNILICPLDWGIGHATRCVPIIRKLLAENSNIIIAASNRPLSFLKREFPNLEFIDFPGYNIRYPDTGRMTTKMIWSAPMILRGIQREHRILKKIVQKKKIDIVISDHRYGLWNKKIKSIFITHQLMIKCPTGFKFLEPFLHRINRHFICKYDECWVPDYDCNKNFSGDLSHLRKTPSHVFFIGPLSRFDTKSPDEILYTPSMKKYDLMFVLSGPEPQRTILEKKIFHQLQGTDFTAVVLLGKTEENVHYSFSENIEVFSHLTIKEFRNYILQSSLIICRSGYSSIMDLATLNKKVVFIPTPGQTEQEYLADYFFENNIAFCMKQDQFDLKTAIEKASSFSELKLEENIYTLDERIHQIL
jgi:uncharacterized protein (TIGR00661 family)